DSDDALPVISWRAGPAATGMSQTDTIPPNALEPVELKLTVADERVYLSLAGTLFGWVHVEKLELDIPPGEVAAEAGDSPTLYQRRRCRVAAATLSVDDSGLESLAFRLARELGERAGGELRLRVLEGIVEISGQIRVGERAAELTARARLEEANGGA